MFETSKLPTEQRTVTGNPVSFNTHYALPLDACKVSFSATQAGSGDPSPSNPRAISGVSAIGLTANSTPVSVSLGEERFGGELDVLTGKLTLSHALLDMGDMSYVKGKRNNDDTGFVFYFKLFDVKLTTAFKCEKMKFVTNVGMWENLHVNEITHVSVSVVMVADYQTSVDMKTAMSGVHLLYELAEPITIQLSPTDLSSIIGNNTFSTDTGSLEISFQDLQEKSASGAVATFNTALAMPLSSCNIAVNAWQEGSGDPSPDNVRPIHGFDKVRVNMANFNQLVKNGNFVDTTTWGNFDAYCTMSVDNNECSLTFVDVVDSGYLNCVSCPIYMIPTHKYFWSNDLYSPRNCEARLYNVGNSVVKNKTVVSGWNKLETIMNASFATAGNKACYWGLVNCLTNGFEVGDIYKIKNVCVFDLTQMFGSNVADYLYNLETQTAGAGVALFKQIFYKDYYAYNVGGTWVSVASVNGDSYPDYAEVNLGETVYGGSYNSVSGEKIKTWLMVSVDGSGDWVEYQTGKYYIEDVFPRNVIKIGQNLGQISNYYLFSGSGATASSQVTTDHRIYAQTAYGRIWIYDSDYSLAELKAKFNETNLQLMLPLLSDYYEINNIGSTPISTNIGNNTIFADTGDVDLTYKDCDLAKRGDFRQVFKIPD